MEQSQVSANLQEIHGTEFSTCDQWNASQIEVLLLQVSDAIAQGKQAAQTNLWTIQTNKSLSSTK